MKSLLNRVNVRTKIWGGLACITLLLVGVAITGWYGIYNAADGFSTYRGLARDSNLCGGLQSNMLMVRMNVKDFIINSDPKEIKQYEQYFADAEKDLQLAKQEINSPKRTGYVTELEGLLENYELNFRKLVEIQTARNSVLDDSLNRIGPKLEETTNQVLADARSSDDANLGYIAGSGLRSLMIARLNALKFAGEPQKEFADKVRSEFQTFDGELAEMKQQIDEEEIQLRAEQLAAWSKEYQAAFEEFVALTNSRNDIISNKLDQIGPQIAALGDQVRLSVKGDQDELGPQVKSANHFTQTVILAVGAAALVLSIIVATTLSCSVLGPINSLVSIVKKAEVERDLTVEFPQESQDEIGEISASLNSFIKQIRATIAEMGQSTQSVVDASGQLNETAAGLTEGASETQKHSASANEAANTVCSEMNEISRATESMQTSITSVSESIEQLSLSIREIAENASNASTVAGEASDVAAPKQECCVRAKSLGR